MSTPAGYWITADEGFQDRQPQKADAALVKLCRDVVREAISAGTALALAQQEQEHDDSQAGPQEFALTGHEVRDYFGTAAVWHETAGSRLRAQQGNAQPPPAIAPRNARARRSGRARFV